jgi:glutamate-1-semialdehyde 2,1-aminomutase
MTATVAQQWFLWTLMVVAGRVAYLVWKHNWRLSMVWFVKLVTDPFTDIVAYAPRYFSAGKILLPSRVRHDGES